MASSNRKIILSTLLAGTAAATGTLMYGIYKSPGEQLIILDDTIPPVISNGMLPPPATYRMSTPPPVEIPGIRRLKITRPSLQTATLTPAATIQTASVNEAAPSEVITTENSVNEEEFYLTGTRSAELIRTPVEARIETFPTVTLDEAIEGALAVDEWGFQVVQSYLNQALGDTDALKERMDALLNRLEDAAGDYDLATISDAANLIIEAGARTHWTAFMAPFVLDEGFALSEGAIGWDLGPSTDKPYTDFVRVSTDSKMLEGNNMQSEGSASGPSILSKGVRNLDAFVANNLKNGKYRVVILTAPRPNGQSPLYPFGVDVKRNGAKINMVDTRATDDLVPVMKLATEGVGRLGSEAATDDVSYNTVSEDYSLVASASSELVPSMHSMSGMDGFVTQNTFDTLTSSANYAMIADVTPSFQTVGGGNAPAAGHMLVTRAEVVDGTLRINFRQLGGQNTYVTAVIIYPEPDQEIEQQLAEEVATFINRVAPAAGENLSVETIVGSSLAIVDPVTAFNDGANGLPTVEANAATPQPSAQPTTETETDTTPDPTPTTPDEPDTNDADNNRPEAPAPDSAGDPGNNLGTPPAIEPDPAPAPDPDPAPAPDPDPAPAPDPDPVPEPQPVLAAEAGIYDVLPLGESFTLDGCGSSFETEAFCNLVDTSAFELVWIFDGDIIGTGETLLVNTGNGTPFGTTGGYNVTLEVRYDGSIGDDRFFDFVTGGSLFLPGDINLTSSDTALIRLIATVPEPSSLFLLAPGLAFVAARQRRRKKALNSK